jgi:CheY-like chemotaxis protein
MQLVLAIDDDPARYQHLARKLEKHDMVVLGVQNPDAANMVLNSKKVVAVFLDHDMPEWDGQYYAREVLSTRNVPVCISSANHAGAQAIAAILREYEVPCTTISVTETAADERWLGWVLDLAYSLKPASPPPSTLPGFRWAPGMLALPGKGGTGTPERLTDKRREGHPDEYEWPHDLGLRVPDPTDLATGGCLLGLLGEQAYYVERSPNPHAAKPWHAWWEGTGVDFTHLGEACLYLAQRVGKWG